MSILTYPEVTAGQAIQLLPPIGGSGGAPFQAVCPAGEHLIGFNLRADHLIDAIQPICGVPVSASSAEARGTMAQFGGAGGRPVRLICPEGAPIVLGLGLLAGGRDTQILNTIHLYCGILAAQQQRPTYPHARYDSPAPQGGFFGLPVAFCPSGLIGVGVHGRSGAMVDSLGLICGPPHSPTTPTAERTLNKRKRPDDDTAGRTLGLRKRPDPPGEPTPGRHGATSHATDAVERIYGWYDAFVGRYRLSSGHIISITREGNRLLAESVDVASGLGPGKHELFPVKRERGEILGFPTRAPGQPLGSDAPPPTFSSASSTSDANSTCTIEFQRSFRGRFDSIIFHTAGTSQLGVRLN